MFRLGRLQAPRKVHADSASTRSLPTKISVSGWATRQGSQTEEESRQGLHVGSRTSLDSHAESAHAQITENNQETVRATRQSKCTLPPQARTTRLAPVRDVCSPEVLENPAARKGISPRRLGGRSFSSDIHRRISAVPLAVNLPRVLV